MSSTVIKYFSYNAQAKVLKIIFVTGMVYLYQDVPKQVFDKLKLADSKGHYFNQYIKDKFDFKNLGEE
ncbi:KTSC domain-containing protein [Pedobacter frigidisoli]|uniref:KTSC domain-containing protein n=1 Tax=Pedobacter frigidisoli TaxID=2530455 RepID=A0A4R0P7E9_9SPHI|nr:KTSC domain-containing protein [Pedobacter frigidisoli]TCD10438.1 KTSC domain-containing protein [Pedobacter frigidisoli]